jgi:hypothetical protein
VFKFILADAGSLFLLNIFTKRLTFGRKKYQKKSVDCTEKKLAIKTPETLT